MTPTQRTLGLYRQHGFMTGVVERRLPMPGSFGVLVDLFGFIDLIAVRAGRIIGVQATSVPNVSARAKKILNNRSEESKTWLGAGAEIHVIGWKKYVKPVDRKWWRYRLLRITSKTLVSGLLELVEL